MGEHTEVVLAEVVEVTDSTALARTVEPHQMAILNDVRWRLAEASTNEVRLELRTVARAVRDAAQHLGHGEAQVEASIIVNDAERAVVADTPRHQGERTDLTSNTDVRSSEAPSDMDLSRMRATHEGVSDAEYEAVVEEARETGTPLTRAKIAAKNSAPRMAEGTGNDDRYTPAHIVEAARRVLGAIDLDPASSAVAQRTVQAAQWHGIDDDGLSWNWAGRVWLNPPWSAPLCQKFARKLITEPNVTAWLMLTHGTATDTQWCQQVAAAARSFCLVAGRLDFRSHQDAPSGGGSFHSVIVWAGGMQLDMDRFWREFHDLGVVAEVIK